MKFNDYIKTAFRNLRRRKARTFLTSFAVAIGTMLILVMVSLGVGVEKLVVDSIKQQGMLTEINVSKKLSDTFNFNTNVNNKPEQKKESKEKAENFNTENLTKIKNIKNVEDIVVSSSTLASETKVNDKVLKNVNVEGYDLNYTIIPKANIEAARLKNKDKKLDPISFGKLLTKNDTNGALVNEKYLSQLGIKDYKSAIGKELTIITKLSDMPDAPNANPLIKKLKITGVVSNKFISSPKIIVPLETVAAMENYINMDKTFFSKNGINNIKVIVKSYEDVNPVSKQIDKLGFETSSVDSIIKIVKKVFSVLEGILSIGGIIVIFVASLGVINTMTMAIYERTRSIGIMKALGASKSNIKWLFITESGAIGFIGGLMGLILGKLNTLILTGGLKLYLTSKGVEEIPNLFVIPLWLVLVSLGFAILISVLAGLYPAVKACKLNPVESLRHE
ncbi:ABC transporter permease [Haloimpatiens sp. FM7330]|uniref:ABC transporter permease n=1 Tax=Haloimpatiens sp. FM7330 TaxID=3298610 RepID=UPI0036288A98